MLSSIRLMPVRFQVSLRARPTGPRHCRQHGESAMLSSIRLMPVWFQVSLRARRARRASAGAVASMASQQCCPASVSWPSGSRSACAPGRARPTGQRAPSLGQRPPQKSRRRSRAPGHDQGAAWPSDSGCTSPAGLCGIAWRTSVHNTPCALPVSSTRCPIRPKPCWPSCQKLYRNKCLSLSALTLMLSCCAKPYAACRARGALLGHHVLAGVHRAHAQLRRAQQLHRGHRDAPEHPAPGLVRRRGRLMALNLRAPPRLAVQAHLAADHAPPTACAAARGVWARRQARGNLAGRAGRLASARVPPAARPSAFKRLGRAGRLSPNQRGCRALPAHTTTYAARHTGRPQQPAQPQFWAPHAGARSVHARTRVGIAAHNVRLRPQRHHLPGSAPRQRAHSPTLHTVGAQAAQASQSCRACNTGPVAWSKRECQGEWCERTSSCEGLVMTALMLSSLIMYSGLNHHPAGGTPSSGLCTHVHSGAYVPHQQGCRTSHPHHRHHHLYVYRGDRQPNSPARSRTTCMSTEGTGSQTVRPEAALHAERLFPT